VLEGIDGGVDRRQEEVSEEYSSVVVAALKNADRYIW